MRKTVIAVVLIAGFALAVWAGARQHNAQWAGVDESVIEKYAEQANRPAHAPFI